VFLSIGNSFSQYQVSYVSDTDSTITVVSVGYAKNADAAAEQAFISALKAVIFQGFKDPTIQLSPLIPYPEEEALQKYPDFFKQLYTSDYRYFIQSATITRPFKKNMNKEKNLVMEVSIRINDLRNYLGRSGIVIKFGL